MEGENLKPKNGAPPCKNVQSMCESLSEEENWKQRNRDDFQTFEDSQSTLDSSPREFTTIETTLSTSISELHNSPITNNNTTSTVNDSFFPHSQAHSTLIDRKSYEASLKSPHSKNKKKLETGTVGSLNGTLKVSEQRTSRK